VKASPKILLPPAILAERDLLTGQPHFKPERQPLLDRLCKATVWGQLSKRRPAIARPQLIEKWSELHLGAAPDGKRTDRELALQMAFRSAFLLAISDVGVRTVSVAEQGETADFYRKKVKQFQDEASLLGEIFEEAAEHARALAAFYEWIADDSSLPAHPSLVASRHQKSAHVRGYCVLLGNFMRLHYGNVLREMVASIASAAFNQAVSKEHVRYWCK
jgi:hypothetical protein